MTSVVLYLLAGFVAAFGTACFAIWRFGKLAELERLEVADSYGETVTR